MTTTMIVNIGALDTQAVALIERLLAPPAAAAPDINATPPPIPITSVRGDRYAGIAFIDGKPHHHLFLLSAKPSSKLNHKGALAWAASIGGELPERFEAALLYANLKDEFETSDYYWTATQSSEAYAWLQHFLDGHQGYIGEGGEFFARAVRRLEI